MTQGFLVCFVVKWGSIIKLYEFFLLGLDLENFEIMVTTMNMDLLGWLHAHWVI